MGEVGRFMSVLCSHAFSYRSGMLTHTFSDMSPQQEIFNQAIEKFTAEQEEVRTAAAFAAGNIAVGNLHHFLPLIVKMVEHDQEKRLLSLHALKEVSRNGAI